MSDVASVLLELFRRQSNGDGAAFDEIARVSDLICGTGVYRDPSLSPQQVRGIELLLVEWRGMFSFYPGRMEGLPPLLSLLTTIQRKPRIEQSEIYETDEWKEVVGLRGPVETVLIQKCAECSTNYPRMGTSGFLDIIDLLCAGCGAVFFRSVYNTPKEIVCRCGSRAMIGCPSCGAVDGKVVEEMSPYRYFADHTFYRDDAS